MKSKRCIEGTWRTRIYLVLYCPYAWCVQFDSNRRIGEYDMQQMQFTDKSNYEVDAIVKNYMSRHGNTTGEPYISGYFKLIGICIQRRRVRESINRLEPVHLALRWGILISRRTYFVLWPNSLWHIDGHHSLLRSKFVIHGCIDGFSRKIIFLQCNTSNKALTVLQLLLESIDSHGGYWPSRIRVGYGAEMFWYVVQLRINMLRLEVVALQGLRQETGELNVFGTMCFAVFL